MSFDSLMQFLCIFAEAVVLVLLLYRGIWRVLPVFSGYIAWTLLTDIATWLVFLRWPSSFLYLYPMEAVVDVILQLLVVIELAWSVLRPILVDRGRVTLLMLGGLIALLALMIWPITVTSAYPKFSAEIEILYRLQQTTALLRVVCFLSLAGFRHALALGWNDRPLQIAAGLAFYSVVSILVSVLYNHQSAQSAGYLLLDRTTTFSYLAVLLYWMISFLSRPSR